MRRFKSVTGVVFALAVLISVYALGDHHALNPTPALAADDCQTFSQTGHQVCGAFLQYWTANGGLAQQGYPISDPFMEMSATDGKTYQVQYFERAVFELHPELPAGSNVLLSLLGSEKYKAKYQSTPTITPTSTRASTAAVVATATIAGGGTRQMQNGTGVTLWATRGNASDIPGHGEMPTAGNSCLSFDLSLENTRAAQFSYNALGYFTLQLSNGSILKTYPCSSIAPQGSSNILVPGSRDRFWIDFDIPAGTKASTLIYNDQQGVNMRFSLSG